MNTAIIGISCVEHQNSKALSSIPAIVQPWDATGLNISTRVTERKEDRGDLMEGSTEAISAMKGSSNEREEKKKGKKGRTYSGRESAASTSEGPYLPKAAPTRVHAIRGTR